MDELMHYGVLGMKWGVRHDPKYQYTSRLTKKYGAKADKYASKGNVEKAEKYRKRQEASAELDKRDLAYAKRVKSSGNALIRGFVTPSIGGRGYQRTLSALNGQNSPGFTGKKFVSSLLMLGGSYLGGSAVGKLAAAPIAVLSMSNPAVAAGAAVVAGMAGGTFGRWAVSRLANKSAINEMVKSSK